MALGKPVIAADTPDCKGPVDEGKNGYLVIPHDAKSLTEAIEKVFEDEERLRQFGDHSLRVIKEDFDDKKVLREVLKLDQLNGGKVLPESFTTVTELSGEEISVEQLERMFHRYSWAQGYVSSKDVVEVGCGSGQGLALLAKEAKSLVGSDYDDEILAIARDHYGDRFAIMKIDAADLPFSDNSKDVIVIFEALYYIANFRKFFSKPNAFFVMTGAINCECK